MPQNVTDSITYPATLTVPADGDSLNVASIYNLAATTGFQGLANRTAFLNNRLLFAAPRIPVTLAGGSTFGAANILDWKFSTTDTTPFLSQQYIDAVNVPFINLPFYNPYYNSTLLAVTLNLTGAGGHAALPTMPFFRVIKMDLSGTRTVLATGTDSSGTTGAYQAAHNVTANSINAVIDSGNNAYMIQLYGEVGTNRVIGLQLNYISVTYSPL